MNIKAIKSAKKSDQTIPQKKNDVECNTKQNGITHSSASEKSCRKKKKDCQSFQRSYHIINKNYKRMGKKMIINGHQRV